MVGKGCSVYQQWLELIGKSGLTLNEKVDYTVGIYQEERLIATGSYERNILKIFGCCEGFPIRKFVDEDRSAIN